MLSGPVLPRKVFDVFDLLIPFVQEFLCGMLASNCLGSAPFDSETAAAWLISNHSAYRFNDEI